jgi:hypothetical protein
MKYEEEETTTHRPYIPPSPLLPQYHRAPPKAPAIAITNGRSLSPSRRSPKTPQKLLSFCTLQRRRSSFHLARSRLLCSAALRALGFELAQMKGPSWQLGQCSSADAKDGVCARDTGMACIAVSHRRSVRRWALCGREA